MQQTAVQRLQTEGQRLWNQARPAVIAFTGDEQANRLLSDLERYPHLFVLGCIMSQQVTAERAWLIPVRVARVIGSPDFGAFLALSPEWLADCFAEHGLHRYGAKASRWFYDGIQHIQTAYGGDAANIWNDNPGSAVLVGRFRRFKGAGQKIAAMAVNVLARAYKVPMSDRTAIDIAPDRHTLRVFYRLGLIEDRRNVGELIDTARTLHAEYPGIFDLPAFFLGTEVCTERNPACERCYLGDVCPRVGVDGARGEGL